MIAKTLVVIFSAALFFVSGCVAGQANAEPLIVREIEPVPVYAAEPVTMPEISPDDPIFEALPGDDIPATDYAALPMGAELIGDCRITYYCPCSTCCGKWADGITATGTQITPGRTVAVDPAIIPLGSEVIIDGHSYRAEDTGSGVKGLHVDIAAGSHAECWELAKAGADKMAVWIVR